MTSFDSQKVLFAYFGGKCVFLSLSYNHDKKENSYILILEEISLVHMLFLQPLKLERCSSEMVIQYVYRHHTFNQTQLLFILFK